MINFPVSFAAVHRVIERTPLVPGVPGRVVPVPAIFML
jgi:hypothetical protein